MGLVEEIFSIRSRSNFGANDVTLWVVEVFQRLYGLKGLERVQTEVQIRGKGLRGRADIVVEDAIGIETKKNLDHELPEAMRQIGNILRKLMRDGAAAPVGIATDGVQWYFYIRSRGRVYQFHHFALDERSSDDFLESQLWAGLYALRSTSRLSKPTAAAVAEVFRPGGPAFREIQVLLRAGARDLNEKDPAAFASKFLAWHEVFRYVYNNFDSRCEKLANDDEDLVATAEAVVKNPHAGRVPAQLVEGALELFLRHTYLALLAKTLGALVAVGRDAVRSAVAGRPREVLSGDLVRKEGVLLTEDNDFFSWAAQIEDSGQLAQAILLPLSRFSDDYADDVFRHLYEEVVDAETRHDLGEFFTPRWMAELIVSRVIADASARVIDPACGSGTFLVEALRQKVRLAKSRRPEILDELLEQIWGIDVNPLSVVLARTNLYLAYAQFMKGHPMPGQIRLRIYTSDSFILPRYDETRRQITGKKSKIVPLEITDRITVPVLPNLDPLRALEIIDEIADLLEGHEDVDEIELGEPETDEDAYRVRLLDTLKALRHEFGDSLWKYVLRNFGVPPLVVGTFDAVIGNPPWLTYREADSRLQARMKEAMVRHHVRPDRTTLNSFNLAIAFILACAPLLKPDPKAALGFVMPFSLLDSRAHLPFMKGIMTGSLGLSYHEAYDTRGVQPPPFGHNLHTCILIVKVKP